MQHVRMYQYGYRYRYTDIDIGLATDVDIDLLHKEGKLIDDTDENRIWETLKKLQEILWKSSCASKNQQLHCKPFSDLSLGSYDISLIHLPIP